MTDSIVINLLESIIKESPKELCLKMGVYLERNPYDCETYFKCEDGDAHLLQCSNGQHFNLQTLQCGDPCDARCDLSVGKNYYNGPCLRIKNI